MRKCITIFMMILLMFGCISGCEKRSNDQVILKTFHTKTAYPLTEEESKIILDIIDHAEWMEGTSDCLNNVKLDFGNTSVQYHSDCGTFNDTLNNRSYSLSIDDKHTVNQILSNYIELNINYIVDIIDRTKIEPDLTFNCALELFYEDDMYKYYFYNMISQYVIVTYEDGTQEDILTAIKNGRATLDDLDHYGISYYAESKLPNLVVISQEQSIEAMQAGYSWTFKRDGDLSTSMIADSPHPLMVETNLPTLYLNDTDNTIYLLFTTIPNDINVEYYSTLGVINNGSLEPVGEFTVDVSYPNDAGAITMELLDGDYVYDVATTWNSNGSSEGTVHYYFWTTNKIYRE